MSPIEEIVSDLVARGVRFTPGREGGLRLDAPRGVLTPADLGLLRDRKPELVALLAGGWDADGPAPGLREALPAEPPGPVPPTEGPDPDESPPIVVDVPDPRRVRAAIESLGYSVGEANEDGLEEYPSLLDLEAAAGPDRGDSEFLELLERAGFSPLVPGSRDFPAWVDDRDSLTVGLDAIRRAAEEARRPPDPGRRGGPE